jgi:hypothetical protein
MKKSILRMIAVVSFIMAILNILQAQNAWINEIHYDNSGTDVGEFIEVVIENPGSYTLSSFQVDLYNGAVGQYTSYNAKTLDLFVVGSTSGNFTFYTYSYPTNGIQNGAPDGMALSYGGVLITGQFLSYEGTFTAVGGPAAGVLSTDIGVSENGTDVPGLSLQLSGSGTQYSDFTWQAPATATLGNLNNSQSFGGIVVPVMTNAYAISTTAVDVIYNLDITSVDPGDYSLSGTANITFAGATIDGTNANIVHLTGATPAMASDITVDNIADDLNGTSVDFYAGIMPITYTNATNPGGVMDAVHPATFRGIVSADDAFNNVWISDAAGAYHGVLIFSTAFQALVDVGDDILVQATRTVFNNLTEITSPLLISKISTGNTPYGPTVINGSDIVETNPVNTNPAESWEGQLVKINDFYVESYVAYDYRCRWTSGGTDYYFHIGDNVDFQFLNITLTVGATYASITGVIDWYNTGIYYRINPRTQSDVIGASNPPVKLAITSVNSGVDPFETIPFDVTVQAQDALNNPAFVTADVNFTFTTNGGTSGLVGFAPGSTITGTILNGTSDVIVTGVVMQPFGTNVTITANDNNPFGLADGISAPFDVLEFNLPEIIICEVLQDPLTVPDGVGEWFEVYNNSGTPVDMDGWTIKDDGTNTHTIAGTLIVPAYGFAVLGNNGDALTNGGYTCNYVYPVAFALGNADDEIVLILPDGVTEVDRIMWDGGTVWPDPTGASMIFAGLPGDDNNVGASWTTSTLREPSFTGATGDLGSPGTQGTGQFTGGAGFTLDLTLFLQGPYDAASNTMTTLLGANMPLAQPFNPALPYYGNAAPKWLYAGTETAGAIPATAVDWLLLDIRDAADAASATSATSVAKKPVFLLSDGSVVDLDGVTLPAFTNSIANGLFVVVWSRNHVGIMNAAPLTASGTVTYDFSTGSTQVYGGALGYKEVETGVWGMASGDVNADGAVTIAGDKTAGWKVDAGKAGYFGGDLNMNIQVTNKDKNEYLVPNTTIISQVPN